MTCSSLATVARATAALLTKAAIFTFTSDSLGRKTILTISAECQRQMAVMEITISVTNRVTAMQMGNNNASANATISVRPSIFAQVVSRRGIAQLIGPLVYCILHAGMLLSMGLIFVD